MLKGINPFTKIVEEKIQEAMCNGEFDDLPGKGKPLDLEEDSHVSPELRLVYRMLKRAGIPPEEVMMSKTIANLRSRLLDDPKLTEDERKAIKKQLMSMDLDYNMRLEQFRKQFGGY